MGEVMTDDDLLEELVVYVSSYFGHMVVVYGVYYYMTRRDKFPEAWQGVWKYQQLAH